MEMVLVLNTAMLNIAADEYVSWLESEVLSLRQTLDTGMCIDCDWIDIDYYQKKYKNYVAL